MIPLLALCAAGCGPRDAAPSLETPIPLTLTAADGAQISATLYPADDTDHSSGVVLVHDKGGNAGQWNGFARRLQRSGIAAIAFDMRGHGASSGPDGQPVSLRDFTPHDWLQAIYDIQAARNALPAHGIDPDNLAVVGAGMGANLAAHYAAQDETIQALVLVSPGLEYDGVTIRRAFEAYDLRPSLLVATEGDTYAASSAHTLKRNASTFCDLREYPGGTRGMDIIQSLASAREEIVFWLESMLLSPQYAPRAARP